MKSSRFVAHMTAVVALLLLPLVARAGDGTVHRMNEKVPGSYIVMLYKGQPAETIGPELERSHSGKMEAVSSELGMFSIQLPNETAAEAIARDPRVSLVQEDGVLHLQSCYRELDQSGSQWALAHLQDVSQATWFSDVPGMSLNSVRVYVIDGAINPTSCWPSNDLMSMWGGSKIMETKVIAINPPSPGDTKGPHLVSTIDYTTHGTAVASILAGNTYGVVPELQSIVSIVVADNTGASSDNWMLQAASYAVSTHTTGPAVANVSLATTNDDTAFDSMLTQMVNNGIFVAASAGNGPGTGYGTDACLSSPGSVGGTARYPGLLIVGATDIYGYQTPYSNFGACVDIWAPGGYGTYPVATSVGVGTGTSFSSPEAAGAAVLVSSKYPTWRPADVWSQIKYLDYITNRGLRTLQVPLPTSCGYNICSVTVCPPGVSQ
jgi:hypothetical protein